MVGPGELLGYNNFGSGIHNKSLGNNATIMGSNNLNESNNSFTLGG